MIALALLPFAIQAPAFAQGYGYGYDEPYGYGQKWWKPYNKKPKPQRSKTNSPLPGDTATTAKSDKTKADKPAEGPLVLIVSLRNQRVTVYDQTGAIAVSPISSGRVGNPTPMGVFSVLEKEKMHHSNLYSNAPMPNMQRITWSGVALHAGVLPGYPASHGCIRLPHGFSQRLYNMTKTGARVIVTREDTPVQSFSHQALFTTSAFDAQPISATAGPTAVNGQVADASGRTIATQPHHLSDLVGVGSAQAAVMPEPSPAKVSPYRQRWLVEMERRTEALKTAETNKAATGAKIAETAKAADTAKADLKAARIVSEQATAALKKSEAARLAAEKELDAFAKSLLAGKNLTGDQVLQSAKREETLDAKLTEITTGLSGLTLDVQKAGERLKAAEETAETAETARKAALNAVLTANTELKTAQGAVEEAKRREAKRQLPIAIFVSRQTKKLYARQGYAPVLETPIEISEPDKPMGTHVFTALSVAANSKDMNWSAVSVPTQAPEPKAVEKNGKKNALKNAVKDVPKPVPADVQGQTAAAALDRILIPEDVREQIADVMKPGSSLIVSDFGVSNETGQYTDFIISLR